MFSDSLFQTEFGDSIRMLSPLAIVVNTLKEAEMILYALNGLGPCKINTIAETQKKIVQIFYETEYEMIPFIYVQKPSSLANLSKIQDLCWRDIGQLEKPSRVPVIAFIGAVPGEADGLLIGKVDFEIEAAYADKSLLDRNLSDDFVRELIGYVLKNHSTLELELMRVKKEPWFCKMVDESPEAEILCAAETVLELIDDMEKADDEYQEILEICRASLESMVMNWQISSDSEVWIDVMQRLIQEEAFNLPGILDRNRVEGRDVESVENYPLYDDSFYYLPPKLFDKICEPIQQSIGLRQMKGYLYDAGILAGEGKNRVYMTVKVPVMTEYGGILQLRRIRIRRDWLDDEGVLTWEERIKINSERGRK